MSTHETTRNKHDRNATKLYLLEVLPAIVLMLIPVLILTSQGPSTISDPWRSTLAVLPILPAAWVAIAVWRHLRRVDEYQQLGLLRSFGIGFAVSILTALAYGLAGLAGRRVEASEWSILAAGMIAWFIAGMITTRR